MSETQTSHPGPGGTPDPNAGWWMPSSAPPSSPPPPPGRPPFSGPDPYSNPTVDPYAWHQNSGPHGHTAPLPFAPMAGPVRTSTWRHRLLTGLVLVAVAVGGGVTGAALDDGGTVVSSAPAPVSGNTAPTQPLAQVAAAVQPSVVSIRVTGSGGSGEGSGVILRSDGTILTNNHVVAGAASGGAIQVRFSDGRTASASISGRAPASDLAVIKADGVSGLTPATLGSSNALNVGDTVLALGSPLGLEGSVSSGIVSALHRTVNLGSEGQGRSPLESGSAPAVVTDAIQTDAAINPGNSGGPLVDGQGRLVGINTAIASTGSSASGAQGGNIGVGFAIPIDQAKPIADQLINGETPSYAQLGVSVSDATSGGAVVGEISAGSGAQRSGLQTGDVVTQIDETPVPDADALVAAVRSHRPGENITLTYTRNGERRTAQVTLGSSS